MSVDGGCIGWWQDGRMLVRLVAQQRTSIWYCVQCVCIWRDVALAGVKEVDLDFANSLQMYLECSVQTPSMAGLNVWQ